MTIKEITTGGHYVADENEQNIFEGTEKQCKEFIKKNK